MSEYPDSPDDPTDPKYVSVGRTGLITMNKKTFSWGVTAGLIFIGSLIIVVVILTLIISTEFGKIKTMSGPRIIPSTPFTQVGLPENLAVSVKEVVDLGSVSECMSQCKKDRECSGIFFDNNECTLFSDGITLQDDKYHDKLSIYVKNKNNLHFDNKIFLGKFGLPRDFWMKKQDKDYVQLIPGVVTKINFTPNYIKTNKNYIGIYSKYKFRLQDIDIISARDSTYIHRPGTNLEVPWTYLDLMYVAYVE